MSEEGVEPSTQNTINLLFCKARNRAFFHRVVEKAPKYMKYALGHKQIYYGKKDSLLIDALAFLGCVAVFQLLIFLI